MYIIIRWRVGIEHDDIKMYAPNVYKPFFYSKYLIKTQLHAAN